MEVKLTDLERTTLIDAIKEGYFFDDLDDHFICWGFYGRHKRGAAASLVKKGLITVDHLDDETQVYSNITKREMLKMLDIYPEHWN